MRPIQNIREIKKMNVVLINAGLSKVNTEYYPPLGIAYLAAVLRDSDYSVKILDMVIEKEKIISNEIEDCDVVGIYFNTVNVTEAIEISKVAKREGKIVIWGGPHVSFNYRECFEQFAVDYIIIGEGEKAIISLMECIQGVRKIEDVRSLVYRNDKELVVNELENLIEDLDMLPLPARDLLPMNEYSKKTTNTSIIASRGCPYHCSFCAGVLMGRNRYRRRSVESIIQEMDEVINTYGFKRITFFDDIFTIDKKFVLDLCDEIIKREFRVELSCETRIDAVDDNVLCAMRKAGFDSIFFGIESGSQRILDIYNKKTDIAGIILAVELCKKNGIAPQLSFIIGLPDDNEQSIRETIMFAKKLDVNKIWFQPFSPFPGTAAYEDCIKYGLITEKSLDYEKYNLRSVVIGTKYLSKQMVEQLYMEAIMSVYAR